MTDIEQQVVENARKFLLGLLDRMNIDADIDVSEEDDKIVLDIDCDDTERLIGRRGQVIDALQHLVGKVSYRDRNRDEPRGKPLVVDAGGYRLKHIERLESLADRMGRKALESGTTVELNPMSPHDRRIVHMALSQMAGVTTRSEGEGDERRILVIPESSAGK